MRTVVPPQFGSGDLHHLLARSLGAPGDPAPQRPPGADPGTAAPRGDTGPTPTPVEDAWDERW